MGWCSVIMSAVVLNYVLLLSASAPAYEPSVHVEPALLQGSRPFEKQTETAVVRDYLQSWASMRQALDENRPTELDPAFIGAARDRLGETITAQNRGGLHTRYQDRAHDLQIVFYSPEGLSIQMTDNVEYEEQIMRKDKVLATKLIHQHYLVVLTPSDVQWQVRILQATYK